MKWPRLFRPKIMPTRIEIYSKSDCHLCEEAKTIIGRFSNDFEFELLEVNIESDPALFEKFRYEIPIVFINGHKTFKYRVDPKRLQEHLQRRATARSTNDAPHPGD